MAINLSKEERVSKINLEKEEVSKVCLTKNLDGLTARVALVLDYSGSMSNLYSKGIVQETVEKILPIAMNFDDDGAMEMWIFSDDFHRLEDISLNNFYGYIDERVNGKYRMSGTSYAPVIKDIYEKYIKENPKNIPTYVIFITDGENSDSIETTSIIRKISKHPIFFQFIGIGDERFSYLKHLDDLSFRYVDNANFFQVKNPQDITYDDLLNEFPEWLKNPKVKKMLK